MKADKTEPEPEIDQFLKELGNPTGNIPYYAIFPGHGGDPITFGNGLITQNQLLDKLEESNSTQRIIPKTAAAVTP